MRWTVRNGIVKDELGNFIAALPEDSDAETEKIMEVAPEAISAIKEFVDGVNSGTLKPRSAVKEFEKILNRYNS